MTRSGKSPSRSGSSSKTPSSVSTASAPASGAVRARKTGPVTDEKRRAAAEESPADVDGSEMASWTARNRWVVFAIASGACAAFNGVFAKLTTNELSTHIARGISGFFGLTDLERFVEVVVRAGFFGLNLAFNGVMWTLFTQALARGHSTTQVSIMNTSANFVLTALFGLAIFAESLPPLWWAGAALLVAGNVVIGRGKQENEGAAEEPRAGGEEDPETGTGGAGESEYRDDTAAVELDGGAAAVPQVEGVLPVEKDDEDEDVALLGDLS
ncbi:hypothetical protein GGR52DRAFT_561222 [Hypoxylon sp. FL1284]|nr:hypothetical protein GGR52DRAFT_561222 [Hypoxylon sp. FL1284]